MANPVKKGDTVEVIAGDDRGVRGQVLSVDLVRGRVVVQGVNRVYKHVRPSNQNPHGGRLEVERPIHISNVMPISPKTNRPSRVRFSTDKKGQKERLSVDGGVIDIVRKSRS